MKHRWLAVLVHVAMALGACTPAEGGGACPTTRTSTPAPADYYDGY